MEKERTQRESSSSSMSDDEGTFSRESSIGKFNIGSRTSQNRLESDLYLVEKVL